MKRSGRVLSYSDVIRDSLIATRHIGNGQITTAKIGDGQITTNKIGAGQVTTVKIADEAVIQSKVKREFATESTVDVPAGGTSLIARGIYLVSLGPNTSLWYSPDEGATWRTAIPAGGGGLVVSDGSYVRLYNAGAAAETSYLLPLA